jgi:sucrose-6-phosphate hydrolase SacC (GH32 family)
MKTDNLRREIAINRHYLHIPVKTGEEMRRMTMTAKGKEIRAFDIELAEGEPDFWAFIDVDDLKGTTATIEVNKGPEDARGMKAIYQSNKAVGDVEPYKEPLRGQFHFSPLRGWLNDPNGLVFFNSEYHLFFQHNPYGWNWGNMHWGHAVSRDMVHWRELADALAPDQFGPMFSGSAVVDGKNTSGLGAADTPPLVLIYTAAGNPTVQCIASSTDGRTFTKFSGNPVIRQITKDNRDPKVIWHEPIKRWVMTLYVEIDKVHTIHFLTSPNLKDWTVVSQTEGFFECPDFFELPVDGDVKKKKWVLTAASSEYMVGTFDGVKFTPETPKLPGHRGRGFFAPQTFSDIPENDGRRIQIGWFKTETKGMPFNQSMTIPLELRLVTTPAGPRMTWTPVKELASLRTKSHNLGPITADPSSTNPLAGVEAELVELYAEFEPGSATEVSFTMRGATIVYDVKKQELVVNDLLPPAPLRGGIHTLAIFCDRMGLEVFANDGLTYVPMPFQPNAADCTLEVKVKGGSVKIARLDVHELQSAW